MCNFKRGCFLDILLRKTKHPCIPLVSLNKCCKPGLNLVITSSSTQCCANPAQIARGKQKKQRIISLARPFIDRRVEKGLVSRKYGYPVKLGIPIFSEILVSRRKFGYPQSRLSNIILVLEKSRKSALRRLAKKIFLIDRGDLYYYIGEERY